MIKNVFLTLRKTSKSKVKAPRHAVSGDCIFAMSSPGRKEKSTPNLFYKVRNPIYEVSTLMME